MKISFKGKSSVLTQNECKDAITFFASRLIPKYKNISICIHFNTIVATDKFDAQCQLTGLNKKKRPSKFNIHLKDGLDKFVSIMMLAHELTHVYQFVRGDLQPCQYISADNKKIIIIYKNKRYEMPANGTVNDLVKDRKTYKNLPWEKEAYKTQFKLIDAYVDRFSKRIKNELRSFYLD